jgi:hypothetical protein
MKIKHKLLHVEKVIPNNSDLFKKCYLCGIEENKTKEQKLDREDVIPLAIFKTGKNKNILSTDKETLIKLRACRPCNRKKGYDEEYVTPILQAISFNKAAEKGFDRFIFKSQWGAKKIGISKNIFDKIEEKDFITPSGISLGRLKGVHLNKNDMQRIKSYFINIAKGLFARNTLKLINWKDFEISFQMEQLQQSQKFYNDPNLKTIRQHGMYGEYWENTFFYRGHVKEDISIWIFVVYDSIHAIVGFKRIN